MSKYKSGPFPKTHEVFILENKKYSIGDIIAVFPIGKNKAISCKVFGLGIGKTKSGSSVIFSEKDVLWRLGPNGKWPNFVYRAFRSDDI